MNKPRLSELSAVQKKLQSRRHKGFSEQRRVLGVSRNNRSNWEWRYRRQGCYSRGLPAVRNCMAVDTGSWDTSRSIFRVFVADDHLSWRSSPGGSDYENLVLELAKLFNPNRGEIRVPEYRRGVKDPNTTQWRHGPVSHTSMLVNHFFKD